MGREERNGEGGKEEGEGREEGKGEGGREEAGCMEGRGVGMGGEDLEGEIVCRGFSPLSLVSSGVSSNLVTRLLP